MCPGACLLCSDVTFGTLDNLEEILKNGNELEVMIPEQPVPQQQATANPVQSGQISPVCVTQKVYTVIVPTKARQSNTVQQPVPQASTDVDAIAAAAELEKREEREEIWLELEKRESRDLVEQERRASAKEFEERQRNVSTSSSSSIPTVTPDTGARTKVVSTSSSGASGVTGKPRGVQSGQISTEAQRPRPGSNLCKASTDVDAIAAAAELEKREKRARRERSDLVEQERRAAAKEFEVRQRNVSTSSTSSSVEDAQRMARFYEKRSERRNYAQRMARFDEKRVDYSTTSIRRSHKGESYVCPICNEVESIIIPASETRRVVLSCDTMYGIWDNLPDNTEHFEMDLIVGGTVEDMLKALVKNYLDLPNRVEIMVIAGINNIGAGETAEQIFHDMKQLKYVVADHSQKWGHSPASYVAFCTLILPPKFCSLYVPPNPPQPEIAMWLPPPDFKNKYDELKKLNTMILEMNEAENLKCVRMDYHGVKRLRSGKIHHKFDTRPGARPIWSETEVFSKLHFTMDMKLKLVGYITECFKNNHRIISDNSNSSNN